MQVYDEMLCTEIGRQVLETLYFCEQEFRSHAEITAIQILEEIKNVLHRNLSDFETVEEIVCIMEKHNIHCGGCHDF